MLSSGFLYWMHVNPVGHTCISLRGLLVPGLFRYSCKQNNLCYAVAGAVYHSLCIQLLWIMDIHYFCG